MTADKNFNPNLPLDFLNSSFENQISYIPELRSLMSANEAVYLTNILIFFAHHADPQTGYATLDVDAVARKLRISLGTEARIRGKLKKVGILESKVVRGEGMRLIRIHLEGLKDFLNGLDINHELLKSFLPQESDPKHPDLEVQAEQFLTALSPDLPAFYYRGEPLTTSLEIGLKSWQRAWFSFTQKLAQNVSKSEYEKAIRHMYPLHIHSQSERVIIATQNKHSMMFLVKLLDFNPNIAFKPL
jgi:hypothetical protein